MKSTADIIFHNILDHDFKLANEYTLTRGRFHQSRRMRRHVSVYCKFNNDQDKILFHLQPQHTFEGDSAIIENEIGTITAGKITLEVIDEADYVSLTLHPPLVWWPRERSVGECEQRFDDTFVSIKSTSSTTRVNYERTDRKRNEKGSV